MAWGVRPAGTDDAPVLAPLCAAHAAYEQIPWNAEDHAQRLARALDAGHVQAWLAWLQGRAVGYASTTLDYSTLAARPFVHLDCLYLASEARGMGLGRALIHAVLAHARAHGCDQLQWQTPTWNAGAIRFYDRLGATRRVKQRYTLMLDENPCGPGH